jgi:8-oxo-dGTP pyrophosphatase MutT (NUDIX family)
MHNVDLTLASVNVIVRDAAGRTLLQMRDSQTRISPLLWGFWGGAVDVSDESAHDAAARELSEELCVPAASADFLSLGRRVDSRRRLAELLLYRPPLSWKQICICEGAGAAFFWRREMRNLPLTNSVAWYLDRKPEFFCD